MLFDSGFATPPNLLIRELFQAALNLGEILVAQKSARGLMKTRVNVGFRGRVRLGMAKSYRHAGGSVKPVRERGSQTAKHTNGIAASSCGEAD